MKLYRNWIINEVARAGEHTNERTYVRTYVLTYIRTGQTLYPLHNFVVRGDNNGHCFSDIYGQIIVGHCLSDIYGQVIVVHTSECIHLHCCFTLQLNTDKME